jgi:hypothetical protein
MKETAVEWLIERLMNGQVDNKMLETAKEMEKQQIVDAYYEGKEYGFLEKGEQYYNETFKQQ